MCFPPSFFDMMEHYMTHLAYQIFILGPMYMDQMYPYECDMVVMKGYVCNRAHPEGFIIAGYTTEEVIECCVDYIKDGQPIGVGDVGQRPRRSPHWCSPSSENPSEPLPRDNNNKTPSYFFA
jgi:hypothetical protein